jgi:hypothetical protein
MPSQGIKPIGRHHHPLLNFIQVSYYLYKMLLQFTFFLHQLGLDSNSLSILKVLR